MNAENLISKPAGLFREGAAERVQLSETEFSSYSEAEAFAKRGDVIYTIRQLPNTRAVLGKANEQPTSTDTPPPRTSCDELSL